MPFDIDAVFKPVAEDTAHPVLRTDIVVLSLPYLPVSPTSPEKLLTLTILEDNPHYAHFDLAVKTFSLEGLHAAHRKTYGLCKQELGAEPDQEHSLLSQLTSS